MSKQSTVIHWFRKGLRVEDNPALNAAFDLVNGNSKFTLRPVYFLDPKWPEFEGASANRWRFLQESLQDLDQNLKSLNSRLYVIRGTPEELFPNLFKEWNVAHVTYEREVEPYAIQRDKVIKELADPHKIVYAAFSANNLYNHADVLELNGNKPVMVYGNFLKLVAKLEIAKPVASKRNNNHNKPQSDANELMNINCYDVPLLEELPVKTEELGPLLYPGGETEGKARMNLCLNKTEWICTFEKPKTKPNSLKPSTTVLSPYLAFGCLSARVFYHKLQEVLRKHSPLTKPPVSLVGQLLWREFFYTAAVFEPNFDKMNGNTICRQIGWNHDDDVVAAWANGQTGYPFIDACMRQLRQEGWIHHLARHAVACFLTRGDLWMSWEKGQKVFRELLLDADWAINAGNWQWLSASAFYYQYFRVYSPVSFGKKTDAEGVYIRKYCPELKDYPKKLIYTPWEASLAEQKKFKCVIGKDYPHRIAIHEVMVGVNKTRMNRAYRKHKEALNNDDDSDSDPEMKRKFKLPPKDDDDDDNPDDVVMVVPSGSGLVKQEPVDTTETDN